MALTLQFPPMRKSRWSVGTAVPADIVQFSGTAEVTEELKIDLEVVISDVWIQSRNYFLGCTYAELFLSLNEGKITDWTKFEAVTVVYKNTNTKTRTTSVEFKPTLESEGAGTKIQVGMGGVSGTAEAGNTSEATFSLPEDSILARPIDERRAIQWVVPRPEVRGPFRNWIASTLKVRSTWDQPGVKAGTAKARYKVDFFGEDRTRMSGARSFLMKLVTWGEDRRTMRAALAGEVTRPFNFEIPR